ncbi:MAG: DUF1552 domain-containing protein [Polyangiaceae bacterium]
MRAGKNLLSRRGMLRSLGAGLAAIPFARVLAEQEARAAAGDKPLRFIAIYHNHGKAKEYWDARPGETEKSFALNYDFSPFQPLDDATTYGKSFKDKVVIVSGLAHQVALETGTSAHGAISCLTTGAGSIGSDLDRKATSISIDQFLARKQGLGADTPFPCISLGASHDEMYFSWGEGGAPQAMWWDPWVAYDQLFSGLTTSTDAAATRNQRIKRSMVDFASADLGRLSARLPSAEKVKLDQHLTALQEIQKRLDSMAVVSSGCQVPAVPLKTGNSDPKLDVPLLTGKWFDDEKYWDRVTDLQIEILAQAMACDRTRFATLYLSDPESTVDNLSPAFRSWEPDEGDWVHNMIGHVYSDSDAQSIKNLARLNRYFYSKLAKLMMLLDRGGVLEDTIILMGSDTGNPSAHSLDDIPLVLAGGAGGRIAMGRRLNFAPATLTPMNRVLVNVCQAFGVDTDKFGLSSSNSTVTGTLTGLV